jgi:hypothetical protein
MDDGYLKVATRQCGASDKYSMQNRLRFTQLVHAQHFVEMPIGTSKIDQYEGLERHRRRKRRV